MKIHFLFGGEAVTKYRNKGGIEALKDVPFATYCWEDGKSNPFDLLNAYDGWELYTKISEEEFDQLFTLSWS